MKRTALAALLSHWRYHPLQLVTLVLGLALATALWSGVQAINAEARASYDRAAQAVGGTRPVITGESGGITRDQYVSLRRAGWQVTPLIEGWIDGGQGRIRLIGIDPLTAPTDMTGGTTVAEGFDLTAFLSGSGQILTSPATANRITSTDLPPVVTVEDLGPGLALTDIGTAQRLLEAPGRIDRLIVRDTQPLTRTPLSEIAPDLELSASGGTADLARLTDSFHLNLTAFGLLSFAVGLFIVHGAIGLAFEQRRALFRTLRALGVPANSLTGLMIMELVMLALLSGLLGVILGYAIAAALIPDVAATLRGLYGVPVEGALSLRPVWWAAGIGISILGALAAAAGVIWKVARLPVLAPARPRAWAMATGSTILYQAAGAALLAIIAVLMGMFGTGLIAGFTMLGALLIAAALLLPAILSLILSLAARFAQGPIAEWFWADTRQQIPGLSLALMALLLALATNIGVGTMVSSFRLTFTGWLDQRLASELYVTARDEAEAAELIEWLRPRTDAILPIWNVDGQVAGAPAEIFGVADHTTYRDNWPLLSSLPDVWDRVADGTGILINEQLARREDLSPGDSLAMPDGWEPTISGVYSDYGNPLAQVLISVEELTMRFPDVERLNFGLRLPPDQVDPLTEALVTEFGLPEENTIDQISIKRFSLEVFDRTFLVSGALNVLTLAVAGFAILTSLLTLASMRLPQLAPAWALGMTRAQLAGLELIRALALALLTALLAIPVGLLLAWVLLAVINVEAFGWRLPMHLFPANWLVLALLALLAAGLAGLWPSIRLSRLQPATLLKVFSHER